MDGFLAYIVGWSLPALMCLLVGLGLLIFEMFTPGMGIPGLLDVAALVAAIVLRADTLASALITLALILVILGIAAFLYIAPSRKVQFHAPRWCLKIPSKKNPPPFPMQPHRN